MEKLMLIAGCSHAAGSEIDGTEDSHENRRLSFGGQLAVRLGYRPINIATPGFTNASIARSVLKWFAANYDPQKMDLRVLISWTESNRIEVPYDQTRMNDGGAANWFDVTSNDFFNIILGFEGNNKKEKEICRYFHRFIVNNLPYMEVSTVQQILMIQYFLKSHNVKYLMCNSMQVWEGANKHLGYYLDLVDKTKYMGVHSQKDEVFYWKYKNLGYVNENAQYWHLGEEPHHLWSQELYNFSQENQCL
jgi:hypothetical protein